MLEIVEHNENMRNSDTSRPVTLTEPRCDIGCRRCYLECAILPDRLLWWQREVERLRREQIKPGHPRHQHWRDHLRASEGACEGLKQQIAATRNKANPLAAAAARDATYQLAALQ